MGLQVNFDGMRAQVRLDGIVQLNRPPAMAVWGNQSPSTNNRMEITGLLEGLRALKDPTHVQAHVDSTYLTKAFTDRWLDGWQRRGWVNSRRKPVANRDLLEELLVAPSRTGSTSPMSRATPRKRSTSS